MKKILLFLLICMATYSSMAQENVMVDPKATVRTISGSFNAIEVSGGVELYLAQGNEESVAVSVSNEKYLDRFKTEVKNGTLKIWYDNKGVTWKSDNNRKLKAYVSFKTLEKLYASAGSEVMAKSDINSGNLDMKFTSGSGFEGKINASQLTIEQNSGSEVSMSGKVDKINVDVSSGAEFKGYDLAVDYCNAAVSSGGGIHITINKELSAKASSGGDIRYKGMAMIREVDINSGGTVKRG